MLAGLKKVLFPLGLISAFAVIWFGLYKPELKKIAKYKEDPQKARQKIEAMMQKINAFQPPDSAERIEWIKLAEELERRIPKGKQISQLYADLSALAEEYRLMNFQRRDLPGTDSTYQDGGLPRNGFDLELSFECEYAALVKFLNSLRKMERLTEVIDLEVTRKVPLVGVKMVVRTYYIPQAGGREETFARR